MDATIVSSILGTVGPLGALVIAVVWVLTRRQTNGSSDRYQVVVTKLDGLRDDVGEIKTDVRDLRASLVRHLEDHANA
jgi:hypothetical protein